MNTNWKLKMDKKREANAVHKKDKRVGDVYLLKTFFPYLKHIILFSKLLTTNF